MPGPGRRAAGFVGSSARIAGVSLLAIGLTACVSMHQERLGAGEEPTLVGPVVRDNRTPTDPALACFAKAIAARGAPPLVIGVGDVRDYTGKYSVSEGNAITQGGALMVYSALGKLGGGVSVAERFDPTVAERELGYTDRRQLGDGLVHDVAGPAGTSKVPWLPYFGGSIAASNYYIVGGITELNYDIRSGGIETGVSSIGPKARTFTESVAIDLRIVDTRSLLVVKTISLTKQFTGYEVGFNVFRFFGSNLFDINIGAKGQEPLQLGIRTAIEEAAMRLVAAVAKVDAAPCMAKESWTNQLPVTAAELPVTAIAETARTVQTASAALNTAPVGSASPGDTGFQLPFDFASSELAGASTALVDRIAAAAAKGPVEVTIAAHDTETLDPAKRDALTDQRVAALVAALSARGIAGAMTVLWRPAPTDTTVHRGGAGLQNLVRLRIGR